MGSFCRLALSMSLLLIAVAPSYARGGGGGGSRSFEGSVHVRSYLRRNGTEVQDYWRRPPGVVVHAPSNTTASTSETGTYELTPRPPASELTHDQTFAEWREECKSKGHFAGSGWGFCVIDTTSIKVDL